MFIFYRFFCGHNFLHFIGYQQQTYDDVHTHFVFFAVFFNIRATCTFLFCRTYDRSLPNANGRSAPVPIPYLVFAFNLSNTRERHELLFDIDLGFKHARLSVNIGLVMP